LHGWNIIELTIAMVQLYHPILLYTNCSLISVQLKCKLLDMPMTTSLHTHITLSFLLSGREINSLVLASSWLVRL